MIEERCPECGQVFDASDGLRVLRVRLAKHRIYKHGASGSGRSERRRALSIMRKREQAVVAPKNFDAAGMWRRLGEALPSRRSA